MQIVATCLPRALLRPPAPKISAHRRLIPSPSRISSARNPRPTILVAASAASSDEFDPKGWLKPRSSKKSVLSDLIQEVEPLDLSLIQRDVSAVTVDAMKRTISGMLGILPSDQFHVMVEALWEHLFKLLVSSMMTGYTLRNADYRLSLEKNLETFGDDRDKEVDSGKDKNENVVHNDSINVLGMTPLFELSGRSQLLSNSEKRDKIPLCENIDFEDLGELTTEAKEYIHNLKCRLSSVEKDLHDVNQKNSAMQMQQFVGEEKNDLLDYLRSLQPKKVLELSEPTYSEVQEIIYSVAHGLLATLSPKIHSKPPPQADNVPGSALSIGKDDCAELLENAFIHLQPLIAVPRDYLARLLFWCLLLGHYIRGLEHRLELMQLLMIAGDSETDDDYFG